MFFSTIFDGGGNPGCTRVAPDVQLKTVEESYQKTLLRFASFSAIVSEMVFY